MNKLAEYLNSEMYSNIHVLNRAQILEDALWLFEHKKLGKEIFIHLTKYLARDVDYLPWVAGDDIIQYLVDNTGESEGIKVLFLIKNKF